ncbi:tyrosine-type recombinase/integrase [Malaciobacter canalis]|uniref:tyrosine-type recombinase/integrase n=1 Tax=Malaciobacter canalis TaxID=1912871 RepID=UPI003850B514
MTFAQLEVKFVAHVKESVEETNKVLKDASYKAYANTFNKLKRYFDNENIVNISYERFKSFRNYLRNEEKLSNRSVNGHMNYLAMFLDFAKEDLKIIEINEAKRISSLKEEKIEKENFTKEDIKNIFDYNFSDYHKNISKILAHSGMRISELYNLTKEDIKKDENNIYFFNLDEAKTENGNRKIPIHKDILEMVLNTNFPISSKSINAFNKEMLRQLYKVVDKNSSKSIHTFRANFISECINNFPDRINIIQEINGHSQGTKSITIDRYAKGFNMKLKKEIVDSVSYIIH